MVICLILLSATPARGQDARPRAEKGSKGLPERIITASIFGLTAEDVGEWIQKKLLGEEKWERMEIAKRLHEEDYEGTINLAKAHLEKYPLKEDNVHIVEFKAEAHLKLEQDDEAIASFREILPLIKKKNNVDRYRHNSVYFSLGELLYKKQQYGEAATMILEGVKNDPNNFRYQVLLGDVYWEMGKKQKSLAFFKDLKKFTNLNEEKEIILDFKINEILGQPFPSRQPVLSELTLHSALEIWLMPINSFDPDINLEDLCLFLESKYRLPCKVKDSMEINERSIWNASRKQYNGTRILEKIKEGFPKFEIRRSYILAVTGNDIFGENNRYVFSWQDRTLRAGVVSTHRFLNKLDPPLEKIPIGTRRVGIQMLSTTGSLLGFSRPLFPRCPSAFPMDLTEFLNKRTVLCPSTVKQLEDFLSEHGGPSRPFSDRELNEIRRVYRTYYFN